MATLRWGLLSTARINRALIPPLRSSERNELVAVASRSGKRARDYAAQWSIPRSYGSYENLLTDPDVDVVYVPLPNHLHATWAIRAAEAGKHVLCEKPLALTVDEVDAIADAAADAGVVVAEAFMYRHHPRTLRIRELVADGALGNVQMIRGSFSFMLSRPDDIRLKPECGGGSLWDVGCYPLSFARFVLDAEPLEVYGQQVTGPTGVDLTFSGQLRFPDDVLVQIDSSFRAPLRMHAEVVGTEGVLNVPRAYKPDTTSTLHLSRDDDKETFTIQSDDLYQGEVEDMADAVLNGKAPRVSLSDSRRNVAAITALLNSARDGEAVPLSTD